MTDPSRPGMARRPSLRRTITRVAAASVTAVAIVWSGLTINALAQRHAAATTAPPALSAPPASKGSASHTAAPAPAPVTTRTS